MGRTIAALMTATMLAGCATYKELPPAPIVMPEVEEKVSSEQAPRDMDPKDAIGGALSYVWAEDREFTIYAPVGSTVPVSLIKGEKVRDVTLTDHFGWANDTVSYGSGRSDTPVVVVTAIPGEAKTTTAIITTSKRMYMMKLMPRNRGHKSVRFHPPQQAKPITIQAPTAGRAYTMKGPFTPWRPLLVTDDGKQTWLKFDPSTTASGMPTIIGIDADGVERPVNARKVGNHVVGDGVYSTIRISKGEHHVDARRL